MALPLVVAGIVAGVAVAPEVIEGVENAVDKIFGRSIVFDVTNATAEPLRVEMDGDGHSGGGFAKPPPHVIAPFSAAAFASRGHGDVRGSMRLVGDDVWLGMSFSNPWVGNNSLRSSVNGRRAAEFNVHAIAGKGNTNARFVYVAFYSDVRRLEQAYQAHKMREKPPIKAMGRARPAKKAVTLQDRTEQVTKVNPALIELRKPK